jgi:recombination protein RecT
MEEKNNLKPNGKDKAKEEPKKDAVAVPEKNITDNILNKVKSMQSIGTIHFPQNYSYENALKSAWLTLQTVVDKDKKPALQVCTKESIANALFDMVVQGLTPVKKQCYFVVYGNKLQLSRSYMGTVAVTKRLKGVQDVFANIIYEGDDFEYQMNLATGKKEILKHDQCFENIDPGNIKGAYAILTYNDGRPPFVEIMNIKQIRAAWGMGNAKGNSPAHKDFADEMAKKTVINRACKMEFNTSDDSDILIESIQNTLDSEALPEHDYELESETEIQEHANKEVIDFKPAEQSVPDISEPKNKPIKEPTLRGPGF